MHTHLPTCVFGSWSVTSLRDSLHSELAEDRTSLVLRMFFYAVSNHGWRELRKGVERWRKAKNGRTVVAFVGTDHGITDPSALELMKADNVDVRLMEQYQGIFHPKVVWLEGGKENVIWVGSNNLTRDGLLRNIEFAVVVRSVETPAPLTEWLEAVESGASVCTPVLLASYKAERTNFERSRAQANATTFTWSKKREPKTERVAEVVIGDLIMEVMPKETGTDGTQIQIPKQAVAAFFGLTKAGAQKTIQLSSRGNLESRDLTMTVFGNHTVRLSISELEYRDRPCLILFRKMKDSSIFFEIVPKSIFPTRYELLLAHCRKRTRQGSRRWTIVKSANL